VIDDNKVSIPLPVAAAERIESMAKLRGVSVSTIMDEAIGDEAAWAAAIPRLGVARARRPAAVRCACCPDGCRHQLHWKGKDRCECTPDRLSNGSPPTRD